jgi:hypothetical protein
VPRTARCSGASCALPPPQRLSQPSGAPGSFAFARGGPVSACTAYLGGCGNGTGTGNSNSTGNDFNPLSARRFTTGLSEPHVAQ